jgi:hypothetical protein
MKTFTKTIVFQSKEEFDKLRKNQLGTEEPLFFNGVSVEYAKEHPDYEMNNATNAFCWNCSDCVDCIACNSCKMCVWCIQCTSCSASVYCEFCINTVYSVWCKYIQDSVNCHLVKFSQFCEESTGLKDRMDPHEPDYYYDLNGKKQYWPSK